MPVHYLTPSLVLFVIYRWLPKREAAERHIADVLLVFRFEDLLFNVGGFLQRLFSSYVLLMRFASSLFYCLVCCIPAVIAADWAPDGIFSSSIKSRSKDNQVSGFDVDLGSESNAGATDPCAPDNIHYIGKLRARLIPCSPPLTSNEQIPDENSDDNYDNESGSGNDDRKLLEYPKDPKDWIVQATQLRLQSKTSELCPLSELGMAQHLICHEGPEEEIRTSVIGIDLIATQIDNAICCMFFFFSSFSFLSRARKWRVDLPSSW